MPVLANQLPNAAAFRLGLAAWLTGQEANGRRLAAQTSRGPDLIAILAKKVYSLPDDSQQLRALHTISSRVKPRGSLEPFTPTARQCQVIALVGQTSEEPDEGEVLNELIAVGAEEAFAVVQAETAERIQQPADEKVRQAEEAADHRAREAEEKATAAIEEAGMLQAHLQAANGKVDRLTAENAGLLSELTAASKGKPKAKTKTSRAKATA